MHVVMIFLDGVGMGEPDPSVNPLFSARLPVMRRLMGGMPSLHDRNLESSGGVVLPLDATLGVPGLPQSGTGQASLLAGINGPRRAGHHFGPHPPSSLHAAIERKNIFRRVMETGKSACFANAFPQGFFDYAAVHPRRLSMTTLSCRMSGLALMREQDLRDGRGVSADLTGEGWKKMGSPAIPVVSPQESGRCLAGLAARHHFTLFEYWKTDFAGHSRNMAESAAVLECLDAMLEGLMDGEGAAHRLLVLSSDHGNIEDLSVKTHTRNPVPLLLHGRHHRAAAARVLAHSRPGLHHVAPVIVEMLAGG
jgi:hypothetical protein